MQIPKWIVGLVIALAVLLALGGMALSPKFKVSRSVTINAPAAKVYALMADPRVVWLMNGDMGSNPLLRWMTLFVDGMVGKDFEAGLANLKALAEKP